jgi:membrane-associated phospholipid phosphatase
MSGILAVSIILSTMFIKQHSCFDVITAFLLAYVMYRIVYVHDWSKGLSEPVAARRNKNKEIFQ